MPYNQVSAMGVQHGMVSPLDEFAAQRADAMRRAQMEALRGGGGASGGTVAGDTGGGGDAGVQPQQAPEIIGNTGTPYAPIDQFNRQVGAAKDLQTLQGNQAMSLEGLRGQNTLANTNAEMLPSLTNAKQAVKAYEDQASQRTLNDLRNQYAQQKVRSMLGGQSGQPGASPTVPFDNSQSVANGGSQINLNAMGGGSGPSSSGGGNPQEDPNMAMMRDAIALGQDPSPFISAGNATRQHQWDLDAANRSIKMELAKGLLNSTDPSQRNLGLRILSENTGQAFSPQDSATLSTPSPTASAAMAQENPQVQFAVNQAVSKAKFLVESFGATTQDTAPKVKALAEQAVQAVKALGIPEDQARSIIMQKFSDALPGRAGKGELVLRMVGRGIGTAGVGTQFDSDLERSNAARDALGLQ